MAAVAAGVARFLAIESCGQCEPCKLDGLVLARTLAKLSGSEARQHDMGVLRHRLSTVADRSRCFLATQQQVVLESIMKHFPNELDDHLSGQSEPVEPALVAELIDIRGGVAVYDERHRDKQPDWTYNAADSGTAPVDFKRGSAPPWRR
jgi:hypothetical protein